VAKPNGKNNQLIDDPQRCQVCNTQLTLYPKDYAPCPHCQKKVCRTCWGTAWTAKAFTAEACSHLSVSDNLRASTVTQGDRRIQWDWPKIGVASFVALLAAAIVVFLFNLFA
jgi:hypothetical protein